jgi:hypothetical protein
MIQDSGLFISIMGRKGGLSRRAAEYSSIIKEGGLERWFDQSRAPLLQ